MKKIIPLLIALFISSVSIAQVTLTTSSDTTICINGTAILSAIATGANPPFTLIWNNGLIGNGPHQVNPTASSTTYNVYAQDATGAISSTQSITVSTHPPITINNLYLARTITCVGDTNTMVAVATGGGTGLIYTWFNGNSNIIGVTAANTFVITPSYDGEIFSVTVSDSCTTPSQTSSIPSDWSDTPQPTYIIFDTTGCINDPSFVPMFRNTTSNLNTLTDVIWDFGNGTTYNWPYSSPFLYSYGSPGTYYVTLTVNDQYGCIWDTIMYGIRVKVDACTGINETSTDFGLTIYPNPSNGEFTIEKPIDLNKTVHIKILDVTSRLILETTIKKENQNKHIDISKYDSGIYYIQLIINDQVSVKRILIE